MTRILPLIVWQLDRLGRNLKHLVNTVDDFSNKNIGFKILTRKDANIETNSHEGKLVFGVFALLANAISICGSKWGL